MKVSARTAVSLVMYKPDGTCQAFPLRKSHVIIGRTHCCDLRIPLSSVSRKHCEIVIDDSQVLLKDLGSTNGTFVNSARVTERSLHSGDDIAVGPVRFRLEVDEQITVTEDLQTPDAAAVILDDGLSADDIESTRILRRVGDRP